MYGYDWILSHNIRLYHSGMVLLCMSAPRVWTTY
jgi:hypothetical protein